MTRIETTFETLKAHNKKALIPYIMAGDPNPQTTVGLLHDLVKHGADMIEIGLPFSDPMADGPTVALAAERALDAGTSTRDALKMVAEFRTKDTQTPIILMGYLNPVEIIGYDNFVALCEQAGVDGVLMVDLPPSEAGSFTQHLTEHTMNEIFLLSPTTVAERRQQVLTYCGGYIYYVSLTGVTGSATLDTDDVAKHVQAIKAETDLPVCVGFGIRDGASAKAIGAHADGVIVGSALVQNFADIDPNDNTAVAAAQQNIMAKMDELREALDSLSA
ncbi:MULTISPECIES: tryptophan synthase subunit alpha [unclassified Psychrobacter]|uniref:tryptophan synthase subunit alpha n=1 Tax=unclassified Psychrobacter TaxID=196806 RepID=UPI001AE431AF|nr:tryptophan synthase subunit alpha [Psychrobacter sp. PL15]